MVGLIAFILLSPQAREHLLTKFKELKDYVMDMGAGYHVYPVDAEYTVVRTLHYWNNNSAQEMIQESAPRPTDKTSTQGYSSGFQYLDGNTVEPQSIQKMLKIEYRLNGQTVEIPLDGSVKSIQEAISTGAGSMLWWPGIDIDNEDMCVYGPCIKWSINMQPNSEAEVQIAYTVSSTSHSWWKSSKVDSKVQGSSDGVSESRAGTFDQISTRTDSTKVQAFTSEQWYNRGGGNGYAIDAVAGIIVEQADMIMASLPDSQKDNTYAFARATFDLLYNHIEYDGNAPTVARSGPQCIADQKGDCDEVSNAFMSIMRTRGIPTWYVFGALTNQEYVEWEGHGWAMIMLPLSDDWCNEQGIRLSSCFVEAAVDVVNHKWLLHTTTAFIDWEEVPDPTSKKLRKYYSPVDEAGYSKRIREFSTEGDVQISSGTFMMKVVDESL